MLHKASYLKTSKRKKGFICGIFEGGRIFFIFIAVIYIKNI
jgi:hypothetical protein